MDPLLGQDLSDLQTLFRQASGPAPQLKGLHMHCHAALGGLLPARPLHLARSRCQRGPGCGRPSLTTRAESPGQQGRGPVPSQQAMRLLDSVLLDTERRPGAEYGEGFVEFRIGTQPLHLDVEMLNERLKLKGAHRMRTAMRPDEAYGMVFTWENVIANTRAMQQRAWRQVAAEHSLPWSAGERNIYDIRPERAITEVLQWTRDWGKAQKLAYEVALAFSQEFQAVREPGAGVREWLQALASSNVPCALVTTMDRVSLVAALERMGLSGAFKGLVTSEDGMETKSQNLLSAAIKLGRPPSQCVAFESSPAGLTAAHNCTMKAVAVQGVNKGYQLKAADLTVGQLSELSVYNVRRLFANRGAEFMSRQLQHVGSGSGPVRRARIANAVFDRP